MSTTVDCQGLTVVNVHFTILSSEARITGAVIVVQSIITSTIPTAFDAQALTLIAHITVLSREAGVAGTGVSVYSIHTLALSTTAYSCTIIYVCFTLFTGESGVTITSKDGCAIQTSSSPTAFSGHAFTRNDIHITVPSGVARVANTGVVIYSIHTLAITATVYS